MKAAKNKPGELIPFPRRLQPEPYAQRMFVKRMVAMRVVGSASEEVLDAIIAMGPSKGKRK